MKTCKLTQFQFCLTFYSKGKIFSYFCFFLILNFSQEIKAQPAKLIDPLNTIISTKCVDIDPLGFNWWKCDSLHPNELFTTLKPYTGLASALDSMPIVRSWQDSILSLFHNRYQQYYKGLIVEDAEYSEHHNGIYVTLSSGHVCEGLNITNTPTFTEEEALEAALDFLGSELYAWNNDSIDYWLDSGITHEDYYPEGELVYTRLKDSTEIKSSNYVLAWKFNIWSSIPYSHKYVYINALTNQIIKSESSSSYGSFNHNFYGAQTLDTKWVGGIGRQKFYLEANDNGHNIKTKDRAWGVNWGYSGLPNDGDDNWGNNNWAATMSHWGVEKSWDFWTQIYSWQGINNNGAHLKVWADVRDMEGTVNNAEFMKDKNGTNLKFGRINGRLTSALDVCGHEYTHGVVSNTAKLTSNGISGALNESYSDIFGFMTERFIFPSTFDWQFGEDVDISIVRSFNNPSSIPFSLPPGIAPDFFPSTYPAMVGDANFYTGTGDDGGVHINCTVQNRCFNLLSVGGTQNSTLVTGIGIDNAALIAEYALMNFVKTHTNFPVNRMHWVNAAIFLFGRCSYEHFQTCRAWKAVNVGDICEPCALPIDCWDWRSGKRSIRISEFSNSLSKVNIYPNPTSSLLTLNLSELTLTKRADIISIKLLDINGREIKEIPFSIDEKVQILLNDVQNGIYVLKIESHNEVKTLRVLKI